VVFTTNATTFAMNAGPAQVTASGLTACAGKNVRVAFSRDVAIPLVGVAEAPVSAAGTLTAEVELPPIPGDYVLVAFDTPAAPCVPGGKAVSSQHFTVVHDTPAITPVLPPPPLPSGVSFTLNKTAPYSSPADQAIVWTVSGLTRCTGTLTAHLVDENGQMPPALWAPAPVSNGVAAFSFPLTPIGPGRYYLFIGETCSGAVMTAQPVTVLEPFSTVTPVATPKAPVTGTGGPAHPAGNAASLYAMTGLVLLGAAGAGLAAARRRRSR
jgi:hypothetical protein